MIRGIFFQSRLSVEETVKTTNKLKKNSNIAANYDDTQFVCNIRVMTELCINGMNDLATKVNQIFSIDLILIKSKGCGLFSINFSSFSSIKINRIN